MVEVSSSLQLHCMCRQKSGSKAAIHSMHTVFEADDTDAKLSLMLLMHSMHLHVIEQVHCITPRFFAL